MRRYLIIRPEFLIVLIVSVMSGFTAFTQQRNPVQASVVLLPPYTTEYNSYVSPASNKMRAVLTLLDFSEPSVDVRFSIAIEGPDYKMQTKESYIPNQPLTMTPGVPLIIEGSQWVPYFETANLDFFGISREQFIRDGRFTEGMYSFSVIVREYRSGKEISQVARAVTWLKLNDQPTLQLPKMGEVIAIAGPQNIFFQWQINTPSSSGIPFTPAYKLFLYELINQDVDPIYALDNGQTILVYESPQQFTNSLNYNLSNPTLDIGKKYMWRVQALDPSGQNIFRDNGFSPNGWFYYGYPTGGEIVAVTPESGFGFNKSDPQFLTFTAPDNTIPDQRFDYRVKVVEIDDPESDLQSALELPTAWVQQQTPPTSSTSDYTFEVRQPFKKEQYYAWQVKAFTGQQEIAMSEPQWFKGPPLLDEFRAGIHRVVVTEIDDADLSNLTGKGNVKIYETDTDSTLTEVSFEGLQLEEVSGLMVLKSGEISSEIEEDIEFELAPRNDLNSPIYFYPKAIKLNNKELAIRGLSKYPFPHPVNGGSEAPMLETEEGWVNFDRYQPYGELSLGTEQSVALLEPFGYELKFAESSQIQLFYDEYNLQLDGMLMLSDKIPSVDGSVVGVPFRRAEQLYYMQEQQVLMDHDIQIIPNTSATFNSLDYVIDLSEKESPRKITDKDWKGVYFNEFSMVLYPDLDQNGQLMLDEKWELDVNQNASRNTKAWVDGLGLQFEWEEDLRGEEIALFNSFPAKLDEVKVAVENSALKSAYFEGSIVVQAIDPTRDIPFIVPADQEGFKPGYLTESLDNSTFAFNPYGGENKVEVTIKRAVFKDNDHLSLTSDFYIPKFDLTISNISDFNLYGDYSIGFSKRNGAADVSSRPRGTYDGQSFSLIEIGASLVYGSYVFSYNTEVNMGHGFDTPTLSFHSITPAEGGAADASLQDRGRPEIYVPQPPMDHNPKELLVDELRITYENDQVYFTAGVALKKGHPTYGTHYTGQLEGELKIPAKLALGGNIMYGNDPHEFFYLDAFYVDEAGVGVTVYPNVNMVGAEGWIYSHMNIKKSGEGDELTSELVLDDANDFGFNLFGQFIDQSAFGANYQLDGSLEYTSSTKDIIISGDISMINTNVRDPNAAAGLSKQVAQEVAQEVAKQVLEAIGGIDETVSVSGVDVRIKLDESSGSLGLSSGGYTGLGTIDISGTPSAMIDLSGSGTNVNIKGDVRDAASASFESGGISSTIDYKPNSGGTFSMSSDAFTVDGSVNPRASTGDILFDLGEVSTTAKMDMNSNEGSFTYDDGTRSLEADANMSDQKAAFTLDTGEGAIVELDADASQKSGAGTVFYEGSNGNIEVGVGFNQQSGMARYDFKDATLTSEAEVSQQGVLEIKNAFDGNTVNLNADATVGGSMDFIIDGHEANGWMKLAGQGGVEYRSDAFYIKAEGDQTTKAGAIAFEKDDLKIAAAGDPAEQTGMVDVAFDGNQVVGNLTLDEQSLQVVTSEVTMNAIHNKDSTGLSMTKGDELFAVGGDPQNKKGFAQFKTGSNEIFVKADQPAKTGALRLKYDNISAAANIDTNVKSADFNMDDLGMAGMVSADSATIELNQSTNQYSIAVSQAGKNKLRVKRDDIDLTVQANQSTKAGSFDMEVSDFKVKSAVNPSEVEMGFADKTAGTELNASANKDEQKAAFDLKLEDGLSLVAEGDVANKIGKFSFANTDMEVEAEAYANDKKGSMHFKNADVDVTVNGDQPSQAGSIDLTLEGDKKVFASFDGSSGDGKLNVEVDDSKTTLDANTAGQLKINSTIGQNTVVVEADKETGGKMDLTIEGNQVGAWMYTSGLGGLEFSQGELYVKAEGNQKEQSGALAFKNSAIDLAAEANAGSKSGEIDFSFQTNKIHGAFSEQLQEISFEAEGAKLIGFHDADSTLLSIEESGKYFAVGGDPANQRGFVNLRQEGNEINVAVDQPIGFGQAGIKFDGMELSGLMSTDRKTGYFRNDQLTMSALLEASDSIGAELGFDQNLFTIGLNSTNLNNSIHAKTADFESFILARPNDKAGSFSLSVPDHDIRATLANSNGQFAYSGAVDLSGEIEREGNARLNFEMDDMTAYLDGGQTRELNSLGFSKGQDKIDVAINKAGDAGQASVDMSGKKARAVFNPTSQYAVVGEGSDTLRVTHLGGGVGQLDMALNNMSLTLQADPNKGVGNLNFDGSGNTLAFNALVNDKKGDFQYTGNGMTGRGSLAKDNNSLFAEMGENYLRVSQTASNYGGGIRYGQDSLGFDFLPENQQTRMDLAFQNNTINGDVNWQDYKTNLGVNLEDFDCNFDLAVSQQNLSYSIAEGCDIKMNLDMDFDTNLPAIDMELPGYGFKLGTLPNIPYQLSLGDIDLSLDSDFGFAIALPNFNLDMPSLNGLSGFGLADLPDFQINVVDFDVNMPNVDFSGFDPNVGLGTIDFSALSGIPLTLDLSADLLTINLDGRLSLDFSLDAGWTVRLPDPYGLEIAMDYEANWKTIKFSLPDFIGFDISPGNLQLFKAGDLMFDINADRLNFNLDGYSIALSPELMDFNMPEFEAGLGLDGFALSMADISADFNLDTGIDFKMGDLLSVDLGADFAGLDFNGYSLNLTNDFGTFGLDLDGKLISFDPELFSIDLGDYSLNLNTTDIGFAFDTDFLKMGYDGNIDLSFGDIGLNVNPDIGVDFETPDFTAGLKTEGLWAKVEGINFDLDYDPKLTVSGFGDHVFGLTPNSFDYQFGDIRFGHIIDQRINFEGFDVNLDIDKLNGLEAFYGDYGLGLTLDGGLNMFINEQNYMKINPDLFDIQFEGIDVDFGVDPLLSFNSPFGDFNMTPESLAIGTPEFSLGFDTDLNFNLKGPELDFNISPVAYGFTFADYGLGLDADYVMDFKSPDFSFRTDDLNLEMGDWTLGLKLDLQGDFETNIFKDLDTSFKLNSLGLGEINTAGLKIGFGGPKFFDFNYGDVNLYGGFDKFDFNYGDYTIGLGVDTLFSFNMPDLDLAFSDPQLDFNYGDYQFGFSPDLMFGAMGDVKIDIGLNDYSFGLAGLADHSINLSFDGVDYQWGTNLDLSFGVGEFIKFDGYDMSFELNPVNGFDLGYEGYGISLSPDWDLGLTLGVPDNFLNITPELMDFNWDNINLGFGIERSLWFNMDPYGFELNPEALALSFEDLSLGIGLDQSLEFIKGPDISLKLNPQLIDFKMPDYGLNFDTKILGFTSPDLSFTTADLMFDIGDYKFGLTLIDEIPSIRLFDGLDLDMSLNMDRLARLQFQDLDVSLSSDLLFDLNYDNNLNLFGNYSMIKMGWDDYNIKIGLDTLINLDLSPCKVMFLLQDPSGSIPDFKPGLYSICDEYLLSANTGGLRFQQGLSSMKRSFTINERMEEFTFDEYEQDRFTGQLALGNGYKYKLNYLRPDDGFGGGLGRVLDNNDLHVDLGLPDMQLLAMRTDQDNKIEGMLNKADIGQVPGSLSDSYKNDLDAYVLYTGSFPPDLRGEALEDLLGISLASTSEEGENLEGSPDIVPNEPKYIGTIADKAGGFLRGDFKLEKSGNQTIMTGNVKGDKVVSVEGAYEFKASPDTWSLKMGSRPQPITIKAGDYANFQGYLWLDPNQLEIGFGASGEFKQSWDVEVVEVYLEAGYDVSTYFIGTLDPLGIDEAGVDVKAYFKLDCKLCEPTGIGDAIGVGSCTDKITLASVKFAGSLSGNIDSGSISGRLSGTATVFGIDLGELETSTSLKIK